MFPYERIKQKMIERGVTNADIARATGKSTAAVSKWVTGQNIPKGESMDFIARILGVSSSWLLTGNHPAPQMIRVDAWDNNTPLDDDEVSIPFYKDFLLACGDGAMGEALSNEARRLRMSKATLRDLGVDRNNAAAMTAVGDSMSPLIKDRYTIYVDQGKKNVKDGKIFAFCHGGLFKVKYLYNLPFGGLRIVSENASEFPEERYTAEEIKEQHIEIVGWVFSWQGLDRW